MKAVSIVGNAFRQPAAPRARWPGTCLLKSGDESHEEGDSMKRNEIDELLCQALETETGGVQLYETALRCVVNEDLREEWNEYLEHTREHERVLRGVLETLGIDASQVSTGRAIVRAKGEALVKSMEQALSGGDADAAQLVACECVVDAETKDHLNWELIGELGKQGGTLGKVLREAHAKVEEEEDEHLYHTQGWCRELWLDTLGLPAELPPPEERKDVKTAIGAARAKQDRKPKGGARKAPVRASARTARGARGGRNGRRNGGRRAPSASR
jgi:hypothetical protein